MQYLTEEELKAINGGIVNWLLSSLAFAIFWDITNDPEGSLDALNAGSRAAQR